MNDAWQSTWTFCRKHPQFIISTIGQFLSGMLAILPTVMPVQVFAVVSFAINTIMQVLSGIKGLLDRAAIQEQQP